MQVLIDDVDTPLLVNSLDVTKAVGQRSTASLALKDEAGVNHYDDGQRIDLKDADGNLVYSGVLDGDGETKPAPAAMSALLMHAVGCKDWHYLADKRLVAKAYAAGLTCGAIFRDLLANVLSAEGVTSVANYLSANQSNVETNTSGLTAWGGGSTTITRDTTEHWQGAASLKVVTGGSVSFQGASAMLAHTIYRVGVPYTASVYLKGSGVVRLQLQTDDTFAVIGNHVDVTLTSTWTRYSVTGIIPAGLTGNLGIVVDTTSAIAQTWYMDGMQIEVGTAARTWALGGSDFIADGIVLPDVVFNYATAAACADAIAQRAGAYWWQIDEYKQFWFQPYAAIPAPWALTADGNGVVTDARNGTVKVKRGKPMYRNRQYIINVTDVTDTQVETRKGDGNTTAWTFGYPFAKVPTVKVNGVAQTVGIKGVDSGKAFYWNAGDATLTQDSSGTVLTSSDTLEVTYVGQFQMTVFSEDGAQVLAQQTLEGGGTTGYVEDVLSDPSLTTKDAAFQRASALLARFAQKATTLTFQTSRPGLEPGQLLHVNIPAHALNEADLLIESVRISDEDGILIWYTVTALLGPVNSNWVSFFGALIQQAQTSSNLLSVGSNATLVVGQSFSESWGWTESLTVTVNACTFPGAAVYPSTSLYPC